MQGSVRGRSGNWPFYLDEKRVNMDKIVFLTGAGAVLPWGAPTTSDITKCMQEKAIFIRDDRKQVKIGEILFKILEDYYHADPKNINFEDVIELAEVMFDYYTGGFHGARTSFKSNLFATFDVKKEIVKKIFGKNKIEVLTKHRPGGAILSFIHISEQLYNIVISSLEGYVQNKTIAKHGLLNRKFKEFLLNYSSSKIRYYTTNYDRVPVEVSGIDFYDGFDITEGKLYRCNLKKIKEDAYKNSYFNLHGSIYYKFQKGEWIYTPNKINKVRLSVRHELSQGRRNLPCTNILAGLEKSPKMLLDPQCQFYQKFYNDCSEASRIVIIGYSFGDIHLNKAIEDAVTINNVKLTYITYFSDWYKQLKKGTFKEVNLYWSSKIASTLSNICTNDGIDRKRYLSGWLKTNELISIYWKGFSDFLHNKEWKNII